MVQDSSFAALLFTKNSSDINQVTKDFPMSATKTPATKEFTTSANVSVMIEKINAQPDAKTGSAPDVSAAYVETLPEHITPALIKDLHAHNADFMTAMTVSLGTNSIPLMKKNSELAATTVHALDPAGNKFSATFTRSAMVSGGPGADRVEKHGVTAASIELRAARKSSGSLAEARAHLSALATKQLASK